MASTTPNATIDSKDVLSNVEYSFTPDKFIDGVTLSDLSLKEVILAESLLTPGLQTTLKFHAYVHANDGEKLRNYDQFKNATIEVKVSREILEAYKFPKEMRLRQRVYRISNRRMITTNIEEFTMSACDDTLLHDAKSLVSKSWQCTTPSAVVQEVLSRCAKVYQLDVEASNPGRDYIADNIHPFQVVAEQANAALADGNDPSFVHYMTYENGGTHHFRSLKSLVKQAPVVTFNYAEGAQYAVPTYIMKYDNPCDFDLLSDLLNGIDENGNEINSVAALNPYTGQYSLFGNQDLDCGIGGGNIIHTFTNNGAAEEHNMCNSGIEQFRLRRQARMNLLEQDKIAMKIVVPWNPVLNVGKVVDVNLYVKSATGDMSVLYGSGRYLISSLVHNVKNGGYSTTTMDLISETAAKSGAQ